MAYKISVVLEKEDDMYVVHAVDLGVTSQGYTVKEAMANIKEACELYLKYADESQMAY